MKLRYYQSDAVQATFEYLDTKAGNPCVVIPTGGGKTPVLAAMCDQVNEWGGRAVVLAHVKELLQQSAEKLRDFAPHVPVGIYSAGLGRRDLNYAVTIGGIQSIYKKACDLGPVNLIIVDECHMIPTEDDGMYRQFIADARAVNPAVRIVGLTATPYRLKAGEICGPQNILTEVCYEIGVGTLIEEGFLSRLTTRPGKARGDTDRVAIRGGEFVPADAEKAMMVGDLVAQAVDEIIAKSQARSSVLIFSSGVKHGTAIVEAFRRKGLECGFITGETADMERMVTIDRFKARKLKFLCNINVLTTGFDAPNVDCVCMLRPTMSPGLYYQMVGRGFRLCPGKSDCLVLDFTENVLKHGPVDALTIRKPGQGTGRAVCKICPDCNEYVPAGCRTCEHCGHQFPEPELSKHEDAPVEAAILSNQTTRQTFHVVSSTYHVHTPKEFKGKYMMRVDHQIGWGKTFSEYVGLEYGYTVGEKARRWWDQYSNHPKPSRADLAVELAKAGACAVTKEITVEYPAKKPNGEKPFPSVVSRVIGPKPPMVDLEALKLASSVPDIDEMAIDPADQSVTSRVTSPETFNDADIPF